MNLPKLTDLNDDDIRGKVVFARVDFNVPIENGEVENDFRIRKNLPTISWLTSRGAKVILASHRSGDGTESLKAVHEYLTRSLQMEFIEEYKSGAATEQIAQMEEGEVVLFENLRQYDGEEANDDSFAQQLAGYADLYVNDAFPVSHRAHASVVGVPKHLPAYAGLQFVKEVENISKAFDPEHPFLFISAGAKFSTKLPLIRSFLDRADTLYVSGALANPFFAYLGVPTEGSLMPDTSYDISDIAEHESIMLPVDIVSDLPEGNEVKKLDEVTADDNIRDIGPQSVEDLKQEIEKAEFVVWNGPLGDYEAGFDETTKECAQAIAEADCHSVVGGGDTIAAIDELEIEELFTFLSTAGGAMVQFLSEETLPGISALQESK